MRVGLSLFLFLKFVAKSIFHGGLVLDRVLVLLEVQSGRVGVKLHEVSHTVRDLCLALRIFGILKPNLDKLLLGSERKADTNDTSLS